MPYWQTSFFLVLFPCFSHRFLSCRKVNSNAPLWCSLCVKLLGQSAPETRKQLTVNIGLAEKVLSWKEFFISTYASSVFAWGDGSGGRLGFAPNNAAVVETPVNLEEDYYGYAGDEGFVSKPTELRSLTGQGFLSFGVCSPFSKIFFLGIDFIGKTAEMGSIALAFGGRKVRKIFS